MMGRVMNNAPTAADLDALRRRLRIHLYELAPACRIHPARLGQFLAGRTPLPLDVARRIEAALDAELAAIREAAAR
jgi:hypothetical protein